MYAVRRSRFRHPGEVARMGSQLRLHPRLVRQPMLTAAGSKPVLTLLAAPQFTVLAPEGATTAAAQQGAFVFLLSMDAPVSGPGDGSTSFEQLCAAFLPWIVDALSPSASGEVDLKAAAAQSVSVHQLEDMIAKLSAPENSELTEAALLKFLASSFTLNVVAPTAGTGKRLNAAAKASVLFPVFDGLNLTVPAADGQGTSTVAFASYTTANSAFRSTVANLFQQVEAVLPSTLQGPAAKRLKQAADDAESMAARVFTDTFAMIGRQLMQAAVYALDHFSYPLGANDSLETIVNWATTSGNVLTVDAVAVSNPDHPLSAALALTLPSSSYTVQAGNTLTAVARALSDSTASALWTVTEAELINANPLTRSLQADLQVTVQGKNGAVQYTTIAGDTFTNIAAAAGITLAALAGQTALYTVPGLLKPSGSLVVPAVGYKTPSSGTPDTLDTLAGQFSTTVPALALANAAVPSFFQSGGDDALLSLPQLDKLPLDTLWTAIEASGQVSQTAAMVSRFLLYGLRLPKAAGLTLSPAFLYPPAQSAFGLYQMTGQQFPTPAAAPAGGYNITLTRDARVGDVDLSFVEFAGAAGTTLTFALDAAFALSSTVTAWVQSGAFQPAPSYQALPLAQLTAKSFAVQQFALLVTPDDDTLVSLTTRVTPPLPAPSTPAQPLLFELPDSLLQQVAARQNILAADTPFNALLPLMQQFQPEAGSTSPATNDTEFRPLESWTWATRIDFQIKRLPASVLAARPTAEAAVPPPSAESPTLPNAYGVIGASSADILLLEQVLVAMDGLGEAIAPGIFLTWQAAGQSGPALTTLGHDEFLAFLAQTNLSTETNPVGDPARLKRLSAGVTPHGIANSPHEFLRLLWELSVVRSGGYFLYYETLDGGGMPGALFDSTGCATLSVVVAYTPQGPHSFGNTLLNFVNSVLTLDAIDTARDTLRMLSVSAPATSAPSTGAAAETLATVAAHYGNEPGRLVELNPGAAVAGVVVPISGIWRQLLASDLADPAKTLDNLAAYYSAGAVTAITAADIQALNPGVPVALASVFAIPPVQYTVSASAAPGATLGSMAGYYGLSPAGLAALLLAVPGLFPANSTLSLDSQSFAAQEALPAGNVRMELERENGGLPGTLPTNPTPAQKAAYARAFVYQLYQTLSAGLMPNSWFKAGAPFGLPFGPQTPADAAGKEISAFRSPLARMHQRQTWLAARGADPYHYNQTIGFGNYAKVNAAPVAPAAGLPPQSSNPYVGVGTVAQVALRWQDPFGNTLLTPFEQPPAGYAGAISGESSRILYNDLLVPLAGWPSVQSAYSYTGAAGSPVLNVLLAFDTNRYTGAGGMSADQARRDLEQFNLIYFQLHQDYTGLGVPGASGNAVSISLRNLLLATPELLLSDAQAEQVRSFVRGCVQWLFAFVAGQTLPMAPTVAMPIPFDPAGLAEGNIVEIGLELVLLRQPVLVQDEIAALSTGLSIASPILPQSNVSSSGGVVYTQFAANFETAFQTTNWFLKIAEGVAQMGGSTPGNAERLYAVRFGKSAGQGIFFQVGDAPSYYAPKPVSRALESFPAKLTDYRSGLTSLSSFSGVDLNLWFQTCLDAVDTFLSAQYATPAFILDKLEGKDPVKTGCFGQVLAAKQTLGDAISAAVVPILSTGANDASSLNTARETMRQRLLIALGAAYEAGAVVLYGLSGLTGQASSSPDTLHGQPKAVLANGTDAQNQNFSLSAARFPLTPYQADGQTFDPRIAFTFTSKNVTEQSYVPLTLGLNLTHLEFDRHPVEGIAGYLQSRCLVFVTGPFFYQLGASTANVPVIDRALPAPPTIERQQAVQVAGAVSSAAALPLWNYSFDYLFPAVARDTVQVSLEFNKDSKDITRAAVPSGDDLRTALAKFTSSWPAMLEDMSTYLPKIHGGSAPADVVAGALKAVSTFAQYITDVANAYQGAGKTAAAELMAGEPEKITVDFELSLVKEPTTGNAVTMVTNLQINQVAATWNSAAGTISNGKITLPAVCIAIPAAGYSPQALTPAPAGATLAYRYADSTGEAYLTFDVAREIAMRTVSVPGLNVLQHQNAWSSIRAERNKYLFPYADAQNVSTSSDFLFSTPVVGFADVVAPRLSYASFSMGTSPLGGTPTFQTLFEDFFAALFAGGDGSLQLQTAVEGRYSYELAPLLPRVSLPVLYLPPTATTVVPAPRPPLCAVVASGLTNWMDEQKPDTRRSPQFELTLTLFGSVGHQQPLLMIESLATKLATAPAPTPQHPI